MSSPYFTRQRLKQTPIASTKAANALRTLSKRRKPVRVEYDESADEKLPKLEAKPTFPSKQKETKILNQKPSAETGTGWSPLNWKVALENIQQMRASRNAVVDSLGCERTFDPNAAPEVRRYQILVSLMLSSQTRDQVTSAAVEKLKKHGLTIPSIINTTVDDIEDMIHPVGFKKRKAQYLLAASKICQDTFNGDIPDTLEGLVSLPGVGPKMAHICMNVAWDKLSGIGVDTHVHRIANRLQWVKKPTKQPEATRIELEKWLPREEWSDLNVLLVGFGQQTCLPIGPKCASCLNNQICSVGRSIIKSKKHTK